MKRKIKLLLPFLLIPVLTPIYYILDMTVFINIFGCGCVPECETNSLNIPFNANDFKHLIYAILTIISIIVAIVNSKEITDKKKRITYCITAAAVAAIISLFVCTISYWK